MSSLVISRAEIRQLSAEAESAAEREREQRTRLSYRGRRTLETGRKVALISLAGLVGFAIVERVVERVIDGRESRAEHADAQSGEGRGLLVRAGMLAVALLRWSSRFSRAWLSLTSGQAGMTSVPADTAAATDA
jgi:hypothetical protein